MGRLVVLFTEEIRLQSRRALFEVVSQGESFGEIVIAINAPGGDLEDGWGLYRDLCDLDFDITTHNIGSVKSAAVLIFAAGKKRLGCPNATFMLHGTAIPNPWTRLTARELKSLLEDVERFDERMRGILTVEMGVHPDLFEGCLRQEQTVPVNHALDWGLVTEIAPFTVGAGDDFVVV